MIKMDRALKWECEGAEPEMEEMQDVGSEMINIDDEEEIEELHNSLKEAMQDPSVKPKLQCLMVDPSFSMVTVQSEDSGIVWETASSRCSTPWASEGSSPSEQYSLEGSVTQGNIVIIMDEDRIKRRKRTSSRCKLGDRFRKSSSRLPKSRVGEERPAMTEVSVPNIRFENHEEEHSVETKDQDYFNLISEGFEILNIVVPSKFPTVDEEESTKLAENLSYLEDTPKINSKYKKYEALAPSSPWNIEIDIQEIKQTENLKDSPEISADKQPKNDETNLDYLEKFTLLDVQAPSDGTALTENLIPEVTGQPEEPYVTQKDTKADDVLDESFVIISDVEILGERLDEVFYGSSFNAEPEVPQGREDWDGANASSKTLKESGSDLFGSQECVLTPVFLPTGPPKIIDPVLLEEPRAMSFHYSDLYEDALGDRKREEDFSDTESVVSERSFKRRYSDSDDADGYLEKFILKDETTVVDKVPDAREEEEGERLAWLQSQFELAGGLVCAKEENDEVTVSLSSETDKNEHISKEDCKSTGCCSPGHCAPVETIARGTVTSKDLLVKQGMEFKKQCDVAVITKNSIKTKGDPLDILPQKLAQVLEPESKFTKKDEEQTIDEHSGKEKIKQTADIQVLGGLAHKDAIKTKDAFDILSVTKYSEKIQAEVLHEVKRIGGFEDSMGKHQEATDVIVEIQETSIITKKDKGVDEKNNIKGKVVLERNITAKVDIDIPEKIQGETPEIFAQEVISIKETLLDETETKAEEMQHLKVEKEVEPSEESETVTKTHATEAELSAESLENTSMVHRYGEILAIVEDKVSDIASKGMIPKEKLEQGIDKIADEEIEIKPEPESVHIASEQSLPSETDTTSTEFQTKPGITSEDECLKKNEVSAANETDKEVEVGANSPTNEPLLLKQRLEKQEGHIDIPEIETEVTSKQGKFEEIKIDVTEEAKQDIVATKETVQDEMPAENRETTKEEMVDSSQAYSLTEILATKMESIDIKNSVIEDTEDVSKVRPLPIPTKVVQVEEPSKGKYITTGHTSLTKEIPEIETSTGGKKIENRMSPVVSTANVEVGRKCKMQEAHINDTQIEDIVDIPEPPPPVEEEEPQAMRVSPLELAFYEDISRDGSLRSDKGIFSQLRSFAPQEDLSSFSCEPDLQQEIVDELDYEMVTEQEARQSEQAIAEVKEEQVQLADQTLEISFEFVEDLDGGQMSECEPQEEIEIQPMDAFCLVCRCPILLSDAEHQNHETSSLDEAFDSIKNQLSECISALQGRSEEIEDFVSELELEYNTVEENFIDCEKIINEHHDEALKLVMDQYNEMSHAMEEEKKAKLEQLYDQIVSFQENIDKANETMAMTTKEMEETDPLKFVSSSKDINMRLNAALESTMSLELGPRGLLVFEDYAKGKSGIEKKNRQAIPVPQKPHLQPQEANSATGTSVTVYWRVSEDDIIDCFQVYCMEEPQGAISEEYRVTVKESYCNLEELEPDKCYKVWVMAVNYTGCSMPSERLPFRTAPSVPVIQTEQCTVLWDSATLRWSAVQPSAVDSFTLEYCRQYACEREGLRSISGIKGNEQRVLLQPNENYLFYIKSVNACGASEQSEAALISTRGTRFHFLSETAHSMLKVSEDRNSVEYTQDTYNKMSSVIECPAVMGELLPSLGYYYWETEVSRCKAYRIGVAYPTASQTSTLGENSTSWCLHCVPTSIRFELLHDCVESDIFVMDVPTRIGTLLDYSQGRLFFFNVQNGQLLSTFQHTFTLPCHPVFVLEQPGNLELKMTMDVPEFVKHC
ncbi:cardiomyopathy-associated protein 5-like isoform X2 [Myxocyprinus asiaticus]|uniref:cardiomyopathy-associated protein 5-like isoform X2 n=1 Tax=Myxocyprinus asiaticus TaxID=70543 RepID=UPI002222634F|nr:cardiomyopathy-associated protein 5-like isoform X2 [Myxocyprinus asiaticus]